MRNFTLAAFKSILSVFVFVIFFTSCTTDRSLTQGDFYKSRVINKKDNRDYAMPALHRRSGKGVFKKSIPAEKNDALLAEKPTASLSSLAEVSESAPPPAVDIASIDNKVFVDAGHDRLSKKINNLYLSNSDVKSFRKGYKEIKKEQVSKIKKLNRSDDPIGQTALPDTRPGMSIASFVLGIVGLFVAGLICGALAIVFGVIGMKRGLRGLAIAGLILGIVDIVAALIIISSM